MDFFNEAAFIIINELEGAELAAARNPRVMYDERDPFDLSDSKFIKLFRLSKNLAYEFIEDISPFMIEKTRKSALSIQRKVNVYK